VPVARKAERNEAIVRRREVGKAKWRVIAAEFGVCTQTAHAIYCREIDRRFKIAARAAAKAKLGESSKC
jgi:hypothetical protein